LEVRGWHAERDRWLATGDLGHLDLVGRLFLDGREDDMIVSGGENAYPGPVVRALADHPDVADALVEPVPDEEYGQRFRATVELRPGRSLTVDELRGWLRERLSPAERPRDIVLVDALARTETGKPVRSYTVDGTVRGNVRHVVDLDALEPAVTDHHEAEDDVTK
jgi:acyl-CoA synthetase (AMP-forming)/AMP-acid ligase II